MASVLIVADEPAVANLMSQVLAHAGYQTSVADTAARATELVRDSRPDLVLLDAALTGEPGMTLVRRWLQAEATSPLRIIMLGAPPGDTGRMQDADAGVDDHLAKPVAMNELLARVRSSLHRASAQVAALQTSAGLLQADFDNRTVKLGPTGVRINATELRLLRQLMSLPLAVHSRRQLLEDVWGSSAQVDERSVDVCVKRLRAALATAGCADLVETVRGHGYRLTPSGQLAG